MPSPSGSPRDPLTESLRHGQRVLVYDAEKKEFADRWLKVDEKRTFMYLLCLNVPVCSGFSSLRSQKPAPIVTRLDVVESLLQGADAVHLCEELGISDSRLSPDSALVIKHGGAQANAMKMLCSASGMPQGYHVILADPAEGQPPQKLAESISASMGRSSQTEQDAAILMQRVIRSFPLRAAMVHTFKPLYDIEVDEPLSVFNDATGRASMRVFTDQKVWHQVDVPADLALASCGVQASRMIGPKATLMDTTRAELTLQECVVVRNFKTDFKSQVFEGDLSKFLFSDVARIDALPANADFAGANVEVANAFAKYEKLPWSYGKSFARSSLKAIDQRLQLEAALANIQTAGASSKPMALAQFQAASSSKLGRWGNDQANELPKDVNVDNTSKPSADVRSDVAIGTSTSIAPPVPFSPVVASRPVADTLATTLPSEPMGVQAFRAPNVAARAVTVRQPTGDLEPCVESDDEDPSPAAPTAAATTAAATPTVTSAEPDVRESIGSVDCLMMMWDMKGKRTSANPDKLDLFDRLLDVDNVRKSVVRTLKGAIANALSNWILPSAVDIVAAREGDYGIMLHAHIHVPSDIAVKDLREALEELTRIPEDTLQSIQNISATLADAVNEVHGIGNVASGVVSFSEVFVLPDLPEYRGLQVTVEATDSERMPELFGELVSKVRWVGLPVTEEHVFKSLAFKSSLGEAFRQTERIPELADDVYPITMRYSPRWYGDFIRDGRVREVLMVLKRNRAWKAAADGIIDELDHLGVGRGQLLGIDAHGGGPEAEACFVAHYCLALPSLGPLDLRYQREEMKGIPWTQLYESACVNMPGRQVVSLTASCSRTGGKVFFCFYYNEPSTLSSIEASEGRAPTVHAAVQDLLEHLKLRDVQAGQILWVDVHGDSPSSDAIVSAHYSLKLPGRGPVNLMCENLADLAGKSQTSTFADLYTIAATRASELALRKDHIIGISYAYLSANAKCEGYLFWDGPTEGVTKKKAATIDSQLKPMPKRRSWGWSRQEGFTLDTDRSRNSSSLPELRDSDNSHRATSNRILSDRAPGNRIVSDRASNTRTLQPELQGGRASNVAEIRSRSPETRDAWKPGFGGGGVRGNDPLHVVSDAMLYKSDAREAACDVPACVSQ